MLDGASLYGDLDPRYANVADAETITGLWTFSEDLDLDSHYLRKVGRLYLGAAEDVYIFRADVDVISMGVGDTYRVTGEEATIGSTRKDSPPIELVGNYWGTVPFPASYPSIASIYHDITATTPHSRFVFQIDGVDLAYLTDLGKLLIDTIDEKTSNAGVTIMHAGDITMLDGKNIIAETTTGTKIGTGATQKLGFFGVTPVVQQAHIADADGTLADITTKFNTLLSELEALGLLASA